MTAVQLLAADLVEARPLHDALALRGAPSEIALASALRLDFGVRRRMDTVVSLVGAHHDLATRLLTAEALAWLADIGASVVNGLDAFVVGSSPARQLALLEHLGLAHPPSRVVASTALVGAALDDLGLEAADGEVLEGPPVVVRARVPGERLRLEFAGGRLVEDFGAGLPPTVIDAAAEVLGTAAVEFGGMSLARDGDTLWWLGVDTRPGSTPAALGAVAEHVRFRAGHGST